MFTRAIVKTPCKNMVNGISTAGLGNPDYELALAQHKQYIFALEQSGLSVVVLEPDEDFPDSCFVEDTCLITPKSAVITNPGTASRRDEIIKVEEAVVKLGLKIERIEEPGTLDAGDIMMVGDHYYVGLSKRTNREWADQLNVGVEKHCMTSSVIPLETVLHWKTASSYVERNNLLATGEFLKKSELQKFNILEVDSDESYAANSVWINGNVLVPKGFPKTLRLISDAGYKTIEVDVSEYRKLDGGLSCLSLRF